VTGPEALDAFFAHYYRRRPVTATFTGVHAHDARLPDWSPDGLSALDCEMAELEVRLEAELARAGPAPAASVGRFPDRCDRRLAREFLYLQRAEIASRHFYHRNPSLIVGEAIFGIVSLVTRPFATIDVRLESVAGRLRDFPRFIEGARASLDADRVPERWTARARREIEGGRALLGPGLAVVLREPAVPGGLAQDLRAAAARALDALDAFDVWLADRGAQAGGTVACGTDLFDRLLSVGHHERRSRSDLLRDARARLASEAAELHRRIHAAGATDVPGALAMLAADRPTAGDYLASFERTWTRFREVARVHDLVTWPEAPIRYVPVPRQVREAAPALYYLSYRSPALFDGLPVHDYHVTPVEPEMPDTERERRLALCNHSTMALNHVVHHGGLGHHVQNTHAAQSVSRIGRIAAVDGASRIAMFSGGTLAEGWACYAVDLMEDVGALTPLERLAAQHSRVRQMARAVVDIELHQGTFGEDEAAAFYAEETGMPAEAARGEVAKNAMFPATAIMYWLGTSGIHELRARVARLEGSSFSRKAFHDRLLAYGALPVPLIAELMAS
jgi:hypothetical protein